MKDMETLQGSRTCMVRDLSDEVEAGAQARLRIEVTADPPADLSGLEVEILDPAGRAVATAALGPVEGGDAPFNTTAEIALEAPAAPGLHLFRARLAALDDGEVVYPATEAAVPLTVVAHRIAPVVWDVPQALEPGAAFAVKVGARCGSECDAGGWTVTVRDSAGRTRATARLGADRWPGTDGLRYAEVSLTAPDEIGLATWEAVIEAPGAALPHESGRRSFGVRTAPPPDARLRVTAVDAETGAPVEGVQVVVHPFSGRTGADGSAEIAVPAGAHRVFVSGRHYIPARDDCTIEGEVTLRFELEPDIGPTDAMVWG